MCCGGQTALHNPSFPILTSLEALSPTEVAAPPCVWVELQRVCAATAITSPRQLRRRFPGLTRRVLGFNTR